MESFEEFKKKLGTLINYTKTNMKYTVGEEYALVLWIMWSTHIYIYIYIVIHRQTVSFYQNSSVWLDTQDAWNWDRNPSNITLD